MPDELTGHAIPGMTGDVSYGDADKPLPKWRDDATDFPDDDTDADDSELSPEGKDAVVGVLGFDPSSHAGG